MFVIGIFRCPELPWFCLRYFVHLQALQVWNGFKMAYSKEIINIIEIDSHERLNSEKKKKTISYG